MKAMCKISGGGINKIKVGNAIHKLFEEESGFKFNNEKYMSGNKFAYENKYGNELYLNAINIRKSKLKINNKIVKFSMIKKGYPKLYDALILENVFYKYKKKMKKLRKKRR